MTTASLPGRAFRLIAFDWDGAAVDSEGANAAMIRGPLERLLRCGVLVVVIAGATLDTLDRRLARAIRGPHKRNLYLATNHGSEVYGFDEAFDPVLRWTRTATADEDRTLTAIAHAVREQPIR